MGASQLKISPEHKTIRSYDYITRVVGQDLRITKGISVTKYFYMNMERVGPPFQDIGRRWGGG